MTFSLSRDGRRFLHAAILAALVLALAGASLLLAQSGKKSYVFKGTVEQVNASTNSLVVANEKIEGWMDPMTMKYSVDNPEIFKTVKAGDKIEATVYDGDYTLHKVHVMAAASSNKK